MNTIIEVLLLVACMISSGTTRQTKLSQPCKITSQEIPSEIKLLELPSEIVSPSTHSRNITVRCEDGVEFNLIMQDGEGVSVLEVLGSVGTGEQHEFLKVEHVGESMFLTLSGQKFDVKDINSQKESDILADILMDQTFTNFGAVVKLIHDELKIPAWKFPSIMFLYRIGMSLTNLSPDTMKDDTNGSLLPTKRSISYYDVKYDDYHGWFPAKSCLQNGWSYYILSNLLSNNCLGTCGPGCWECWDWVCGDCCLHTGCARHDDFCNGNLGKLHVDCVTLRGVLWDTVTDTPYDC